jgi:hypothetical protein
MPSNHPCLLITGECWWLFFTGYPRSSGGQRSVLVAAVSQTGASWDRVGAILEPERGEVAVSHPCVLDISRTFSMFYASDVGGPIRTALATSSDGLSWDRRGAVLEPAGQGPDPQETRGRAPRRRLAPGLTASWMTTFRPRTLAPQACRCISSLPNLGGGVTDELDELRLEVKSDHESCDRARGNHGWLTSPWPADLRCA